MYTIHVSARGALRWKWVRVRSTCIAVSLPCCALPTTKTRNCAAMSTQAMQVSVLDTSSSCSCCQLQAPAMAGSVAVAHGRNIGAPFKDLYRACRTAHAHSAPYFALLAACGQPGQR